jgi:hypothetical protein
VLRLERHQLGPRVYVCGLRIHEFGIGLVVLALLLAGGFTELWELTRRTEAAALLGAWLVGKDWRDLFPSKRNTASWSLLPHRVPRPRATAGSSMGPPGFEPGTDGL